MTHVNPTRVQEQQQLEAEDGLQGCYRGHGVSFSYPPKWQKTQDVTAPISDLWNVTVVLKKPSDYVEVYGTGPSELEFPAANLAAGKAELQDQQEVVGFHVLPGSEKLTIDGRPGLRFRAKRGKTIENTTSSLSTQDPIPPRLLSSKEGSRDQARVRRNRAYVQSGKAISGAQAATCERGLSRH